MKTVASVVSTVLSAAVPASQWWRRTPHGRSRVHDRVHGRVQRRIQWRT